MFLFEKHSPQDRSRMKAITIDALWAWAILEGHKPVENRGWQTPYRGPLAIHAGRHRRRDPVTRAFLEQQGLTPPTDEQLKALRGRVLGIVELIGIKQRHELPDCPWAFSQFCWVLENPRWLAQSQLATGKLGLWDWSESH